MSFRKPSPAQRIVRMQRTVRHAADLLDGEAKLLFLSCTYAGRWYDPTLKARHDDLSQTAKSLRELAGGGK